MAAVRAPVQPAERLPVLDLLRGFAIVGIVVVNVRFFSTPLLSLLDYRVADDFPGLPDRVAEWLVIALAEGKFYPLLALLFGYGFGLQLERAGAADARYVRRLLGLLVLGLAHAYILWAGDVLVAYAAVGALLPLFRRSRDRTLLSWAALAYAVHVAVAALSGLIAAASTGPDPLAEHVTEVFAQGSYAEVFARRADDVAITLPGSVLGGGPAFLAMMLLGLWAQRRGVFARPAEHLRLLRGVAVWGTAVGGGCSLAYATLWTVSGGRGAAAGAGVALGAAGHAQALGYAAALTLLVAGGRSWPLAPLRPVGRLALTNYLFQSLVATTIFYGYGLGLFGRVGPAAGLAVAAAIAAAGAALSALWLRAFRIGPLEWLLRSLTYARLQPLRRGEDATARPP